jgi:hypothetical protein
MTILTILAVGTLSIACFFIGAKTGQAVSKGEKIEAPTLNPMQIYRESQEKKAAEKEQKRIDTIIRNIENYDGTGSGQEDVPRG